jgi:hypothetical protein
MAKALKALVESQVGLVAFGTQKAPAPHVSSTLNRALSYDALATSQPAGCSKTLHD